MIGEMLGAYRILRRLGAGGMGEVYVAEHTRIARRAAIKLLLPQYSNNSAVVERFFTEARATSLIRHPGIIEILDCDIHSSGRAYIVMELLEGESLGECLRRTRLSNDLPAVNAIGIQAAEALAAAHEKGIIHRDIKPDNIFLAVTPQADAPLRVKVLDFGIAKLASEAQGGISHTKTGAMLGTPVYMSPEQCRGAGAVDQRTDIYSLGCVLFEMLCCRPPFMYEGAGELYVAHMNEVPHRVSALHPAVSPALDQLVADMLAKRADDRPQSMVEVAQRLTEAGAPTGSTMYYQPGRPLPASLTVGLSLATKPPTTGGLGPMAPAAAVGTTGSAVSPGRSHAGVSTPPSSPGTTRQPTSAPDLGTRILLPGQGQTTLSNTASEVNEPPARIRTGRAEVAPHPVAPRHLDEGRGRRPLFIGGAIGAAAVVAVVVFILLRPGSAPTVESPRRASPAGAATVTEPARSAAPADVPAPTVTRPRRVITKLTSTPPGAEIFVGDESEPRGKTPAEVELPASSGAARISLKLDGYKTQELAVTTDESSRMDVPLEKLKADGPRIETRIDKPSPGASSRGSRKHVKQRFAPIDD